jgi:two-component system, chemotaxis family, chemotaxis protein CheY
MAKTILAVDDSISMRQAVSFALSAAGYDVLEAGDGTEAVAKLSGAVHMVITDLNMPKMDGIELIKHIRTNSAHKHIPILMLTTESQPAKKDAAKAAGATCWMVKPFRPEQLVAVVSRVLA